MIPLISVLVPIYKVETYIAKCANSIFNQTINSQIEYIFVDDCSPDNSVGILKSVIQNYSNLTDKIKIIKHPFNQGLAQSRNTALEAATGKYIFIIDSDDWLENTTVFEEMLHIAETKNADIVEANHYIVYENDKREYIIKRKENKLNIVADIITKNGSITIWNKLIKRELYTSNNIKVPININNGEDYVTLPKLIYHSSCIAHLNKITYNYNQLNINSFSSNKTNQNNLMSMVMANKNLHLYFEDKEPVLKNSIERMYLETKMYRLLYSVNKKELSIVRKQFSDVKKRYFIEIRWKYQLIYILDLLKFDRVILQIGKYFRNR